MKTNHTSIELEWDKLVVQHTKTRNTTFSGEETVLALMHFSKQNWFMSWEFVVGGIRLPIVGNVFLSHRAPARISDLSIKYPILIEKRSIGRFKAYRIRYENIDKALEIVPEDMHLFLKRILSVNFN